MAEFVERDLEQFVPVLEQLQNTQLLSAKEVNQLIKKCRRYSYRLSKLQKQADDFLHYASYLRDLLSLTKERRKAIGYTFKYSLIEGKIKERIVAIYRRLCTRFAAREEYWQEYISFVSNQRMPFECSRAFVSAIQMHPHSISLRIQAAMWELKKNGSGENARRGLQMALRLHPESITLWKTLFEVELEYVKKLKKRYDWLSGQKKKKRQVDGEPQDSDSETEVHVPDAKTKDAVMQLKVAEIVLDQAMEEFKQNHPEKLPELLLALWRLTVKDEDTKRLRERIEGEIGDEDENANWQMKLIIRKETGENILDILSSVDWDNEDASRRRFAVKCCDDVTGDLVMKSHAMEHLNELCKKGMPTEEELVRFFEGGQDKEVAENAVKRFPQRALFWKVLLEDVLEELGSNGDKIQVNRLANKINTALDKTWRNSPPEEVFQLYKMAIDVAIQYTPTTVEKVFSRSIDSSCGEVHGLVKTLRIQYLHSLLSKELITKDKFIKEVVALVASPPNTVSLYECAVEKLLSLLPSSLSHIHEVQERAIAEHSNVADVWLARCNVLMRHDACKVAEVYRRAVLSLSGEEEAMFIQSYTQLQQSMVRHKTKN